MEGGLRGDAGVGFEADHLLEQVHAVDVERALLDVLAERDALPLGEGFLEIFELECVGPVVLVGRALDREYFKDLADF